VLTFIIGLVATAVLLILIGGYLVYSSLKRILGDNTLRNKCDDLSGMVSEYNGFHDDHD
jgi:hypothetical protein